MIKAQNLTWPKDREQILQKLGQQNEMLIKRVFESEFSPSGIEREQNKIQEQLKSTKACRLTAKSELKPHTKISQGSGEPKETEQMDTAVDQTQATSRPMDCDMWTVNTIPQSNNTQTLEEISEPCCSKSFDSPESSAFTKIHDLVDTLSTKTTTEKKKKTKSRDEARRLKFLINKSESNDKINSDDINRMKERLAELNELRNEKKKMINNAEEPEMPKQIICSQKIWTKIKSPTNDHEPSEVPLYIWQKLEELRNSKVQHFEKISEALDTPESPTIEFVPVTFENKKKIKRSRRSRHETLNHDIHSLKLFIKKFESRQINPDDVIRMKKALVELEKQKQMNEMLDEQEKQTKKM